MPYCGTCGFQITEEMEYCPNCGTLRNTKTTIQGQTATTPASSTVTRATIFGEGIIIGAGAALLVASTLFAFFLNDSYWRLQATFLASGITLQQSRYLLNSTMLLIGFCAEFAIIGVFLVIIGSLVHVNPSVQAILDNRSIRARWGNAFLVSGVVFFASGSVQSAVRNVYSPESFWFLSTIIFGVPSLVIIVLGVYLLTTAQFKRQH